MWFLGYKVFRVMNLTACEPKKTRSLRHHHLKPHNQKNLKTLRPHSLTTIET